MPEIQLRSSRRLKYLPTYCLHGSGQVKYQAPWSGRFGFWNILREPLPRRILCINKIITLCCPRNTPSQGVAAKVRLRFDVWTGGLEFEVNKTVRFS